MCNVDDLHTRGHTDHVQFKTRSRVKKYPDELPARQQVQLAIFFNHTDNKHTENIPSRTKYQQTNITLENCSSRSPDTQAT